MEQPSNKQAAALGIDEKMPSGHEFLDYVRNRRQSEAQQSSGEPSPNVFLTADAKMKRICEIVEQIANASVSVLITGESGTGKELIARMIHDCSQRRLEKFVAINCAAVPPQLLESELFGHERGAFTGADRKHLGKFEQATDGTLLLDEVTEIEPATQAKLLRALQEREIERLGGNGPVKINTRIIATSNRDMAAAVKDGQFRRDLYYRLYVINLEIPPLRERPKDISLLAQHFLRTFQHDFAKKDMTLSSEAMEKLQKYPWPGNIRELQNVMQRTVLMSRESLIRASDIPLPEDRVEEVGQWIDHLPIGKPMRIIETHFIIETLRQHQGNRTHAAKTLGISLRTLRNKINEFTAAGFEVPMPALGKPL